QSPLIAPQMPLAEGSRGVAHAGKQFGKSHLPQRQPFQPAANRHRVSARTDGESPGQESGATGSALRLDVEVEQARAFGSQLVDAWRGRAADNAAAVTTHFAVAEIVHQDEHDVGFLTVSSLRVLRK